MFLLDFGFLAIFSFIAKILFGLILLRVFWSTYSMLVKNKFIGFFLALIVVLIIIGFTAGSMSGKYKGLDKHKVEMHERVAVLNESGEGLHHNLFLLKKYDASKSYPGLAKVTVVNKDNKEITVDGVIPHKFKSSVYGGGSINGLENVLVYFKEDNYISLKTIFNKEIYLGEELGLTHEYMPVYINQNKIAYGPAFAMDTSSNNLLEKQGFRPDTAVVVEFTEAASELNSRRMFLHPTIHEKSIIRIFIRAIAVVSVYLFIFAALNILSVSLAKDKLSRIVLFILITIFNISFNTLVLMPIISNLLVLTFLLLAIMMLAIFIFIITPILAKLNGDEINNEKYNTIFGENIYLAEKLFCLYGYDIDKYPPNLFS